MKDVQGSVCRQVRSLQSLWVNWISIRSPGCSCSSTGISRPSDRKDFVLRPAMAAFTTGISGSMSASACPQPVSGARSGV